MKTSRSKRSRRRARRRLLTRRLPVVLALMAITAFAAFAAWTPSRVSTSLEDSLVVNTDFEEALDVHAALIAAGSGDSDVVRRANFRYSVVPGGAYTPAELAKAVTNDPVVAKEYGRLNVAAFKAKRVEKPRLVHVSYRVGDKIFWTKKKVQLKAGETILTDGNTQIRGRCGNCISEQALGPTSDQEPDIIELDRLVDDEPVSELAAALPPAQENSSAPTSAPGLAAASGSPAGSGGGGIGGAPRGLGSAGAGGSGGSGGAGAPGGPSALALLSGVPGPRQLQSDGPGGSSASSDNPSNGGNPPGSENTPPSNAGKDNPPALSPPDLIPPGGGNPFKDELSDNEPPAGPTGPQETAKTTPPDGPSGPTEQNVTAVPEPATILLVGSGISAMVARRMRTRRKSGKG